MVAGKKTTNDNSAPVKSNKPSSWFSKWVPGAIAKKAMEAFKLIEKAVFVDNVEESESNKVQVLEIQVKKLQQKVDELIKLKISQQVGPVAESAPVVISNPSKQLPTSVPQTVAPAAPQMEAPSKPLNEVVKSNEAAPVRPRPFSAADLMTQKLKKTKASTEATTAAPAPKTAEPQPVVTAPVQVKVSPVKAVRPPMKPFNSSDLKQIKLNKRKPAATAGVSTAAPRTVGMSKEKTPARPLNKPMSMQSALKNAIKNKFSKAKGSPKKNSSGSDDSDLENEDTLEHKVGQPREHLIRRMSEAEGNISRLKIVLLNFTVQITALKKTSHSLQKHFNAKKIVRSVKKKSGSLDGDEKIFEEDLTRLFEDSMKLFKDAEHVQSGLRSLNSILNLHLIKEPFKSPPQCGRISFLNVDKKIDDILDGNSVVSSTAASSLTAISTKIPCQCESDDEIDDLMVMATRNQSVPLVARVDSPTAAPSAISEESKSDGEDEDDEPFLYGRGYKAICQSPNKKKGVVKTEEPPEIVSLSDHRHCVRWTDRCSSSTSDSVSLVSLPDITEALGFSSTVTTTTTTLTTTTVASTTKRAAAAMSPSHEPAERKRQRRRGRISKEESALIMSVVKRCRYRQSAWEQLERMLDRPVETLKEHYVNKMYK